MTLTCDKHAIDIASLRRPTPLDKLADEIPKPKGAVPNFGLPKWKEMPLESKIPMVPGPEGAYNFTRRKIGKRLWISAPDAEFNLTDPYCYEMELSYDSLHDNHLVPYFSRPNNIRHLIKAGLVTTNLDAKCSLRDYNMYRKYLRKLHCDSIKEELSKRTKWSIEERAIQYAEEQAQKEVNKLKEKEKLMQKRKSVIRNRELAEVLWRQKQKENQQKLEERLQALVQKKREAQQLRHIASKARAEIIEQKQKAAVEIKQKKIIQTLLDWSRKERIRKRTRKIRLAQEQKEKHNTIEQKWQERQEFQEKQIEKKQFLLECIETRRKKFIKAYNEKVNKETERMKRLLEDVKMFIRCYMTRHLPGKKERICCKKYWDGDDDGDNDDDDDDTKRTQLSSTKRYKKSTRKDSYPTVMEQDKDKRKKEKRQVKSGATARVRKESKVKTNKRHSKQKVPNQKTMQKIKEQKETTDQTGGEKTKKGKGKEKGKRRLRKKSIQSEEKSDLEAEESVSTIKDGEDSDKTEDDIPKEKCRCQIIKHMQQAAAI